MWSVGQVARGSLTSVHRFPLVVPGPHHQSRAGAVPLFCQVPGRPDPRCPLTQAALRPHPVQRCHLDPHPSQGEPGEVGLCSGVWPCGCGTFSIKGTLGLQCLGLWFPVLRSAWVSAKAPGRCYAWMCTRGLPVPSATVLLSPAACLDDSLQEQGKTESGSYTVLTGHHDFRRLGPAGWGSTTGSLESQTATGRAHLSQLLRLMDASPQPPPLAASQFINSEKASFP